MEPVEEGTAVDGRRARQLPTLDRLLELENIGPDDRRIQSQRIAADEGVLSNLLPQIVQQLVQRVARGVRGALRTEERHEAVARHPPLARRCQESKQREPSFLLPSS